jgi:hypothetical protein
MSLNSREILAYLAENRAYAKDTDGLLGSIARRENGGRAAINAGGEDARLVSISGGNDPSPYVVTVCLSRRTVANTAPTPGPGLVNNPLPRARLTWGAGKGQQTALVDVGHGTRVTLDCSSLTVDAIYANLDPSAAPRGPQIEFFAGVVYGSLGGMMNTLTEPLAPIGGGGLTPTLQIPNFAAEVKILSPDPASTFNVTMGSDLTFAGLGPVPQIVTALAPNTWLQIPNGMELIQATQTAGAATSVIFQYLLHL